MKLPFAVDRTSNASLVEQMLQGLKNAIVRGVYKPGDSLPGIHELAAAAGVSEKVPRRALAQLAEIGWCVSKRGRNSVVVERGKKRLGRVLFFIATYNFDFYTSWMVGAVRSRILKAGYHLSTTSAFDLRKSDGTSKLLAESLREHWDLVIECGMRPGTRRAIEDAGWPFLVLGDGGKCIASESTSCIGQIELRNGLAVPEFVRACMRKNVRSVVQFLYAEGGFDVSEIMEKSCVSCSTVRIPRCRNQFGMYSGGYRHMVSFLKKAGGRLPDVFLFTDDHLAQSGMIAMMERGIRIPEDVKVVTHSNRGFGPFWVKPLTRLEMDPVSQGADVARAVLEYLNTRHFPKGIVLGSVWRPGKTF